MKENLLEKQRKIYDLSVQIHLLTMAARDYHQEGLHKDCVLEMVERKSRLIKKISQKICHKLEFG